MTKEELRLKVNQILSEEQRAVANILLDDTLPQMQMYYQNKIDELRRQLLDEKIEDLNRFEIAITVCEREKINLLEGDFFVMDADDVNGNVIIEAGVLKIPVWIATDDKSMRQYMANGVKGCIHTGIGDIEVDFSVKKNTGYLDILERCKQSFAQNGLKWRNVNAAYLHKCYFLETIMPDVDEETEIQGYSLECEELADKIRDGVIPLWNVRYITMQANDFPVIQEDKMYYRYDFVIPDHVEMIIDMPEDTCGYCARYPGMLSFITNNNENRQFLFWEIRTNDFKSIRNDYLILTNGISNNMWSTLENTEIVHSAWELTRRIRSLSISDSVDYRGYQVIGNYDESLDYVMAEEPDNVLKLSNAGNYLELIFENSKLPQYIYRNVIQYIADVIQSEFREYIVICKVDVV